jgi:hypothetical protein
LQNIFRIKITGQKLSIGIVEYSFLYQQDTGGKGILIIFL